MDIREILLFKISLADQTARYDDMARFSEEFCKSYNPLNFEERTLINKSFRNEIGIRRIAIRKLVNMEKQYENKKEIITEYKKKLIYECEMIAKKVIELI